MLNGSITPRELCPFFPPPRAAVGCRRIMQKFILDAFVTAATEVFETMMGRKVVVGSPYVVTAAICEQDVNSMVGLSGGLPGNVIVGVDRKLAIDFTENVIGHATDTIDEQVIDAVAEIANMIVGAAKCKLTQYKLSMSLPSVICGRGLTINFPGNVRPVCIPFDLEGAKLSLCVGLYDDSEPTTKCELPEMAAKPSRGPVLAFDKN